MEATILVLIPYEATSNPPRESQGVPHPGRRALIELDVMAIPLSMVILRYEANDQALLAYDQVDEKRRGN